MIRKYFFLIFYRCFAQYLPLSGKCPFAKKITYLCAKNIFKHCGENVNIERKAYFGTGFDLSIGDNSGLGVNCKVPSDITIGENVLMGPNCYIFSKSTHEFSRTDIPIRLQGRKISNKKTIIEDDVWIGRDVLINHGRKVSTGTIIAARSVVTKDYPAYTIIGGNPAKLIRSR